MRDLERTTGTAEGARGAARTALVLGVGVGLGLALGLSLWGAGWSAQALGEEQAPFQGTVRARSYVHSYKMPFDIGVDRQFKPAERVDEERVRVHVPQHYGTLFEITPAGEAAVLWFRDGDGIVRNAVLPRTTTDLLHVEMVPTRNIDVDYR